MADNSIVQLGFALPINTDGDDKSEEESIPLCHQSPYWSNWDGGKIGGKPIWLNPRDVPQHVLRCRGPCSSSSNNSNKEEKGEEDGGTIMQFVAQLYCPADDVTNNDAAFHRSLYVFACSKCCNSSTSSSTSTDTADKEGNASVSTNLSTSNKLSNCIRILRCQLPKQNDFYPSNGNELEEDEAEEWTKHTSQYLATATNNDKLNLCTVCGQVSKGKCPKQQLWFCGPQHQKECLRLSKQSKGSDDKNAQSGSCKYSSVCYESELVVEEEPIEEKTTKSSNDTATTSATTDTNEATLFPTKDITDSDVNLEQSDLNAMTGNVSISQAATTMGVTDPTTLEFYARMSIGGEENDVRDQVLRYNRWPDMNKKEENDGDEEEDADNVGPLWLSSNNRPPTVQSSTEESFPPPCQYCGAPRSSEFQILPQMLHYLLQDPNSSTSNNDEQPRQVLTESERAVLLEAQTKIESGVDLPEGFKEQHEKVLANARESLLSGSSSSKKNGSTNEDGEEMLDWGTIAVYTCTASCGGGGIVTGNEENGAYLEEAAWMQPPLD